MLQHRCVPDRAVYVVTVEGFARAGKTERMLYWLGKMLEAHQRPTLTAYILILRCLAQEKDIVTASDIVAELLKQGWQLDRNRELGEVVKELEGMGMELKTT